MNAPALRWDPSGTGATNPPIQEKNNNNTFNWTAGVSTFVDLSNNTETTWTNAATKDVIIGNDVTQFGGTIDLGSNITVNGKLTFGLIFQGFPYTITDAGTGNTLTLAGGLSVSNNAASSTTPSAEIDAPITLAADQTWNVDPNQFLDIKGQVTGGATTLTKVGTGVVDFEHASGSLGTLNANGGIVLLGADDALGSATVNLNGGGLEYGATGTTSNPINVTSLGGSLGTTTGTATVNGNLNAIGTLTAIGTGTTIITGSVSASTFNCAAGSTGVMAFAGGANIGTLNATSGATALAGTAAIAVGTLNQHGGTTVIDNNTTTFGTVILSGGTIQIGNNDTVGSIDQGTLAIATSGTGTALGTIAFDRTDTFTFTNALSGGSLSIQQNGGGTVIMAETNSITFGTGGTSINNGTIACGTLNAIGASTLQFNGPASGIAALNLSGHDLTVQGVFSAGTNPQNQLITNDQATTSNFIIDNTGAREYDGNFSGNLNIQHGDGIHTGIANETLGGDVSITGNINLYAGTLTIGGGTTSGTIHATPVMSFGTLAAIGFNRSDTVTISNVLSSAVGNNLVVVQSGPGTTIIANTNSFTGGTSITNGTLQLGVSSALGAAGTMSIGSGSNPSVSTFDLAGFNQRIIGLSDGGSVGFSNENVVNSGANAVTLSFASGNATFGGVISGNINILHDGSGSQGLGGNNTFTGTVSVSGGTLSAAVFNLPNTPGPLGEQSDGVGTITLGGPGTRGIISYTGSTSFTLGRPINVVATGVGGLHIASTTGQITIPAGSITGQGGFSKLAAGTLIVQGTELYHGPASIIRGNENVDTLADIGTASAFGFGDEDAEQRNHRPWRRCRRFVNHQFQQRYATVHESSHRAK